MLVYDTTREDSFKELVEQYIPNMEMASFIKWSFIWSLLLKAFTQHIISVMFVT